MAFEFATATRIIFGPGTVAQLERLAPSLGGRPLLVLGGASERSGLAARLRELCRPAAIAHCAREPRVEDVEQAVAVGKEHGCDAVIAAGGGSVLDCGKATAAMMTNPGTLVDYLEGVGCGLELAAAPVPLACVPTTAGTGSEVTKNAVVSGPGYKKSIRSALLLPTVALVDPELTRSTPREVTASCGMDALTQLIEAYLSRKASPLTDGLALQGIAEVGRSLERAFADPGDASAREGMALGSLVGGICLANAGLGAVHGLASPLGALFPIPHGVACAALLARTVRANLTAAVGTEVEARVFGRFAQVSEALTGKRFVDRTASADAGLATLQRLQHSLAIPRLGRFGVRDADVPQIVAGARGSSMRYNPVELPDDVLAAILHQCL